MMKDGSMVVEEYTGERIRLQLTNCKFVDANDYFLILYKEYTHLKSR